jgi:tetratricopeptide (TPR) repeat protein
MSDWEVKTSRMSNRLRAFVSSRMQELAAERTIIKAALGQQLVDTFEFEADAGARPETIQQTYLNEIEEADLYIGIFWKGYGPYTIEEYDHACRHGKSCLVYEKRSALEDRDPRLQDFLNRISRVESGLTVRWFETPEQLGEFVRQDVAAWQASLVRKEAVRGYAAPFQAPALSDQYVERTSMIKGLLEALLANDEQGFPIVTRAAFHGIGGVGKSVIAAAFARAEAVRQRFSDWGRALRDPGMGGAGYIDSIGGTTQLRSLLNERACLLVVDDVWQAEHVRPFLVGGRWCLVLVTTRKREIADEIGAKEVELNEMTPAESQLLAEKWSGEVKDVDQKCAEWLMREVGYLPLALELVGAQVKKLQSWDEYRQRWKSQKLRALKRGRGSRGKEDNVWDSLELSVDALTKEDRQKYWRLGVFPEDTPFPPLACAALWGCPEDEAAEVLIDLADQALLRKRAEFKPRRFVLHDLFYGFVVEHLGSAGRAESNLALVGGYRKTCNGEWHKGPDDGYFFEHLSQHLADIGCSDDLYGLINRSWMEAQFRRVYSHRAFASDLGTAVAKAACETPPNVFQIIRGTFLRCTLASLATRSDPAALAALARMGQADRALGHAELIQDPAKRSQACRLIAQSLLARGETDAARRPLQEAYLAAQVIDPLHFRAIALSDLVGPVVEATLGDLARGIAEDAESAARAETFEYWKADLLIRSAYAQVLAGKGQQAEAVAAAALAAAEKEEDRVRKLSELIRVADVFEKAGDTNMGKQIEATARALFKEVNEAIGAGSGTYLGHAPELSTALVDTGHFDVGVAVAEKWIGSSWEGAGSLAAAANALFAAGSGEQATRIVDKTVLILRELVTREDYSFELDKRIESLGCAVEALVRAGRQEEAIELANSRPDIETKSHALGCIALALANGEHVDGARRAAEASLAASQQLPNTGHEMSLWCASAASALKGVGRKAEASEPAARAVSLSETWKADEWQYGRDLVVLVKMLVEVGQRENASALTERLTDCDDKAKALVDLIRAYSDEPDRAKTFARRAAEIVKGTTDMKKVDVLGSAAEELAEAGFALEAINFAQLAVTAAAEVHDSNSGPEDGLCKAAEALARLGKFVEAREIAQRIVSGHPNENSIRTICFRIRALTTLVKELERAGQHHEAVITARAALDTAREASQDSGDIFTWDAQALVLAARASYLVGDYDSAAAAARGASEIALDRMNRL